MNGTLLTFFYCLLFSVAANTYANEPSYLEIKVKPGDVLYRILTRYELIDDACNVEEFYQINNMSQGDFLLANHTYKLPIQIVEYNGKSIRSTLGISSWDTAVSIQTYNKRLLALELVDGYYMETNMLYVPYHLLNCEPTQVKSHTPKVEYVETDIYFGEDVKLKKESDQLKNHVYYIVSGHGGPDPGAMKTKEGHDLCEDEYAYDVSIRLAKNLLIHGATVHMIIQDPDDGIRDETYLDIDKDEVCKLAGAIPLNQLKRLKQRVNAVNTLYKAEKKNNKDARHRLIAIHVDSRSRNLEQDVFFYHTKGSKTGSKVANTIQDTFREKYEIHQKGRGYTGTVTSRNLYVLTNTKPPAVYVELGNIQNESNHKRILPYRNRQVLANWLFEGLIK